MGQSWAYLEPPCCHLKVSLHVHTSRNEAHASHSPNEAHGTHGHLWARKDPDACASATRSQYIAMRASTYVFVCASSRGHLLQFFFRHDNSCNSCSDLPQSCVCEMPTEPSRSEPDKKRGRGTAVRIPHGNQGHQGKKYNVP